MVDDALALDRHILGHELAAGGLLDAVLRQAGPGQEAEAKERDQHTGQRDLAVLEAARRVAVDVGDYKERRKDQRWPDNAEPELVAELEHALQPEEVPRRFGVVRGLGWVGMAFELGVPEELVDDDEG